MEKWAVLFSDNDTIHVLAICQNEEEAKAFVHADIELWADQHAGTKIELDFKKMYAYSYDKCEEFKWNIEKLNI